MKTAEEDSLVEEIVNGLQKFFQNKSYTYEAITYKKLDEYLLPIEQKLLNVNIIDKMDEDEYNSIWDTIMYVRNRIFIFPKENCVIAAHWSIREIYNEMYDWRMEANPIA